MRKQKVGLTTTNWILSILGILILGCFIVLPPVFRSFMQEEAIIELPKEEIKTGTTVCQNGNILTIDYTDNETLTFVHHNQRVKEFTRLVSRIYSDPLIYQEQKLTYGKLVTALSIISGYEYSAIPEDDSSSIRIQEKYNLLTFKPTTIVVPGDENPTAITTAFQLDQDITQIKDYLTANGYVCSENE